MKAHTLADFAKDQHVRYVPYHAQGDINHTDCENGIVSSKNDTYVFVRFGNQSTAHACKPDQLRIMYDPHAEHPNIVRHLV